MELVQGELLGPVTFNALAALAARAVLAYLRRTPVPAGRALLYTRVVDPLLVRWPVRRLLTTAEGDRFLCRTEDVLQRRLYAFGVWEPAITAFVNSRLRPGDTFVDVGANVGYYTVVASRLVGPAGRVIALEPSPSIRAELVANLALNASANVRVSSVAASNAAGTAVIHRATDSNRGSSSLLASRGFEAEAEVRTEPLDTLLSAEEWASARIIKIDVEGFEGQVIEGMLRHLRHARPDLEIVVEISPVELAEQGFNVAALAGALRESGFNAYAVEDLPAHYLYGPEAFAPSAGRVNVVPAGAAPYVIVFSREDAGQLAIAGS